MHGKYANQQGRHEHGNLPAVWSPETEGWSFGADWQERVLEVDAGVSKVA